MRPLEQGGEAGNPRAVDSKGVVASRSPWLPESSAEPPTGTGEPELTNGLEVEERRSTRGGRSGLSILIGLDVGTTAVKALAMREDGCELESRRISTPWRRTNDGTELDPVELVDAVRVAIRALVTEVAPVRVLGVGVASMAESGVLLDGSGQPISPIIAWHDDRDRDELSALAEELGRSSFSRHTGLPLWPQWSLTKHRWLLAHRPRVRSARRRMNVAEWIVRALGGEEASEQSLASRTGWLDLTSRRWWTEALEWSGVTTHLLPPLAVAGTRLGCVAKDFGIPEVAGAALTVAGHDHQAATIGAHAAAPGDVLDSCGSAEALVRTIPAGLTEEAVVSLTGRGITVGWHVLAEHWALLGGTQAGLQLQRALDSFGVDADAVSKLDEAVLAADARSPVPTGTFSREGGELAESWRSALEAVTAEANAVHTAISAAAGPHRTLTVTGGWSRSAALMAIKRRTFGRVQRSSVQEPGARGAALLAGQAAGIYANLSDFPIAAATESEMQP